MTPETITGIAQALSDLMPVALGIVSLGFLGGIWFRLGSLSSIQTDLSERIKRLENLWFT